VVGLRERSLLTIKQVTERDNQEVCERVSRERERERERESLFDNQEVTEGR